MLRGTMLAAHKLFLSSWVFSAGSCVRFMRFFDAYALESNQRTLDTFCAAGDVVINSYS